MTVVRTPRRASRARRLAALALGLGAIAATPAAAPAAPGPLGGDAGSTSFDAGWRFALVDKVGIEDPSGAYANAASPSYDDHAWRSLSVPHDWSIELRPTDARGANTSSANAFLQGGLGWYRKTFTLPRSTAGKRVSLEFDGVYMDATVYLNGREVGTHAYGYTPFAVDISNAHKDGRTPNVIAVRVQNELPSSRWYSGSGIERHVHLVVTDKVHVARNGVFATTPRLAQTYRHGRYATVRVQTALENDGAHARRVQIVNQVLDARGHVVAQRRTSRNAGRHGSARRTVQMRVAQPHLWSPDSPYLYSVRTQLRVRGQAVDTVTTPLGIRWFSFSGRNGFAINGHHTKIHGVDVHQDGGALGAIADRDVALRQLTLLKRMGVNAVRTAHNPPSPEFVAAANRVGIMLMLEVFDEWGRGKTEHGYGRFFEQWGDRDVQSTVLAYRNAPAVFEWSLGGEIDELSEDEGVAITRRLIRDVKQLDATRPVLGVPGPAQSPPDPGSAGDRNFRQLDGISINYARAHALDAFHAQYPSRFMQNSEHAACTSTRGVYRQGDQLATAGDATPGHRASYSSYDNACGAFFYRVEYALKADRDRNWMSGIFIWSGFDYLGEAFPRNAFPVKGASFGEMDTAGFPKDNFWLIKSQWTTQPMVHLLPMDWTNHRLGENVQVWAYANVDTVELFLDGHSLGVRRFTHKKTTDGRSYLETSEQSGDDTSFTGGPCPGSYTSPNGSCGRLRLLWNVPFRPGTLTAVARKDGKVVARDEVRTAGEPDRLRVTPEKRVVRPDGSSLLFVDVDVLDAHGTLVPDADDKIRFSVHGAGRLIAVDNGRSESAESYQGSSRTAFNGKALAIVRSNGASGPIAIRATAPGLLPGTATAYATRTHGARAVGVRPVAVRTPVGGAPRLPRMVQVVAGNGSVAARAVDWQRVPNTGHAGVQVVHGDVAGTALDATASVTVYRLARVESPSTVVATGAAPWLPARVRAVYSDGVQRDLAVRWAALDAAKLAQPGAFDVVGTLPGTAGRATAHVQVVAPLAHDANLAAANSSAHPSVDASYSGGEAFFYSVDFATVPAQMIDGNTAAGGWSNYWFKPGSEFGIPGVLPDISAARASDWVSVAWPAAQHVSSAKAWFTVDARHAQPATVEVSWWDGARWRPVSGLHVALAGASNEPSTIAFDPVTTPRLKVEMTSRRPGAADGAIQIAELQVLGDLLR